MYYSQRNDTSPFTYEAGREFWTSFRAYLDILVEGFYLHENFGYYNEQDNYYTIDNYRVKAQMKFELSTHIDFHKNFHSTSPIPFTDTQLDIIEFFFKYVSKPTEIISDHMQNITYPVEYSKSEGRYEYTIAINNLFKRHRLAYKIEKGQIERVHSGVLDSRFNVEYINVDDELRKEAIQAVRLFKSRNPANMKTALTTIANAYERAKTLKYPKDKTKSIRQILALVADDNEKLDEVLNEHFKYLSLISNNCDIRHKESKVIIIESEAVQEYLFYTYYNAIRLIISQLEDIPPF